MIIHNPHSRPIFIIPLLDNQESTGIVFNNQELLHLIGSKSEYSWSRHATSSQQQQPLLWQNNKMQMEKCKKHWPIPVQSSSKHFQSHVVLNSTLLLTSKCPPPHPKPMFIHVRNYSLLSELMHYKSIRFCYGTNLSNIFPSTSTEIIMRAELIHLDGVEWCRH